VVTDEDFSVCDIALIRLHRAGWSVGDTAFVGTTGTTWLVSGSNGENLIRACGTTQGEAWTEAVPQARELDLVDLPPGRPSLEN
jgi:hypothetical protein